MDSTGARPTCRPCFFKSWSNADTQALCSLSLAAGLTSADARKVEELSEFSARHHAGAESRSRCFQRVMFCALHNGQSPREVFQLHVEAADGNELSEHECCSGACEFDRSVNLHVLAFIFRHAKDTESWHAVVEFSTWHRSCADRRS